MSVVYFKVDFGTLHVFAVLKFIPFFQKMRILTKIYGFFQNFSGPKSRVLHFKHDVSIRFEIGKRIQKLENPIKFNLVMQHNERR